MKRVTTTKSTDTIDINECHENDYKIYAAIIDDQPCILTALEYDSKFYQWLILMEATKNNGYTLRDKSTFLDALNFRKATNLTQLDNLNELADWLKTVNQ